MSISLSTTQPRDAADAAAAHHELLHRGRQLVVGDGEEVEVDVVAEHHGRLLEHRLEGPTWSR